MNKILLVDDEKELILTLAERLSFRGITADCAESANEALKMAEIEEYKLAVLDLKMPKIDGLKLKKMLHVNYPEMKFIFLTGHGSEDDFNTGVSEDGVIDYLVKPVKIETLIKRILSVFEE